MIPLHRILLVLVLALVSPSCAHFGQEVKRVVACGEQAVEANVGKLGKAVDACLVQMDATPCLLALADPAAGFTVDLIACIAHRRAAEYNAALRANPHDFQSATATKNATKFALDRGIVFAD